MKYLVVGGGQIARQLVGDIEARGHEAVVLRRRAEPVGAASVIAGDAADGAAVLAAARGTAAILHCVHAAYSPEAWRRELPGPERAAMEAGAALGIPVVFPESVYAFGLGARRLSEASPVAPVSPLGQVRAELLAARASHPALTASVVASDLLGPTSTRGGSVFLGQVIAPAAAGKTAWVLGDPGQSHAITAIADLSAAMLMVAGDPDRWIRGGDAILLAPTGEARPQRAVAEEAARLAGARPARLRTLPAWILRALGTLSPTMRQLHRQLYLWDAAVRLEPGRLSVEGGLEPQSWEELLRSSLPEALGATPRAA
jgi:hypothetical protein